MFRLRRSFIFVCLFFSVLFFIKFNSDVQVNSIQNNEYDILLNKRCLTDVHIVKYPKFVKFNRHLDLAINGVKLGVSDNDVVDLLLFHTSLLFNYYIHFRLRDFESLHDDDEVVIDFNKGLDIKGSRARELGFGVGYNTITKSKVKNTTPIIRAVDVFGYIRDDPRQFWHSVPVNLQLLSFMKLSFEQDGSYFEELQQINHFKSGVLVGENHKYKMFQVGDLHFLNGKVDDETRQLLADSVAKEMPDLIVINGDLIEFETANPFFVQTIVLNALSVFIQFKIPYIINFGEADYCGPDAIRMIQFMSNLPYCLNVYDADKDVHGITNQNFKIYSENEIIGVVSVLDTYKNDLKTSQINTLYRFNSKDIPDKIFKLAFIHHPLPNFRPAGKFKIVGDYKQKGSMDTRTDPTFINDFLALNYNVILASHEHENDGCIIDSNPEVSKDLWLCYSSVAGAQATAAKDFERRFRVFEISNNKLLSWKMKGGKGFHYQKIHEFN